MIEVAHFTSSIQNDVLQLILAIQRDEFGFDISADDQPDLLDIPGFYQVGAGNFWVALAEREVVGTIALRDIGNHQGALRKMFVKAAYRGGQYAVAAFLLERLVRDANRRGLHEIFLGTTEKFRAAHRFYEKNGFARVTPQDLPPAFPRMSLDTRFYRRALR
jgi:N-acetylglutamate synthase-like GNAT family acetyltransferase